ncbi:hypothetical protein Cni_G10601 [Canna indica]|uniref:Uncharacterized protein n=1 Tax=Canna indica TaxID=4628 RepID=A0AAQ3K4L0_9LILI|nr:hypothetical protein Cni_G10601 [Canna indica]
MAAAKSNLIIFFFFLSHLLLFSQQTAAARGGLTVDSLKHSSFNRRAKAEEVDQLRYEAPMVFAMLPRGPVPPSGPIGGINGGKN